MKQFLTLGILGAMSKFYNSIEKTNKNPEIRSLIYERKDLFGISVKKNSDAYLGDTFPIVFFCKNEIFIERSRSHWELDYIIYEKNDI